MNKELIKNIRLGLFILVGTILLIAALYLIGSNRNMFGRNITVYTTFKNVNGLRVGNNVRFSGITVGTIDKIEIVNDTTIRIKMIIEADLKKIIRENALASLGTDGLMGNRLINIDPVAGNAAFIKDGDEFVSLSSVNLEDMLRTLSVTNRNVMLISANLKTLTDNINSSRGTLYTVLMDTTIGPKVHEALNNVVRVSNNITAASEGLNEIIGDVQQGKGVVGTLIKDTSINNNLIQAVEDIKSAGQQIDSSARQVKQILEKVNSGKGTIATLVNDTAVSNTLKRSLTNVEMSTQKFSENMEALKHNFLFKGYFKKQEKEEKKKQKNTGNK